MRDAARNSAYSDEGDLPLYVGAREASNCSVRESEVVEEKPVPQRGGSSAGACFEAIVRVQVQVKGVDGTVNLLVQHIVFLLVEPGLFDARVEH
jgi:hypothetical protein